MPPTLRTRPPAFHSRRPDSADERLALKWGMKPKTAKIIRLALGRRLADVIEVLAELDDQERLAQAVAPVEAALAATGQATALDAVLHAARVDATEDPLVVAFVARPCRETARPLYLAKAAEARAHDQAANALRKEFAL
jgi:hypothetical protein